MINAILDQPVARFMQLQSTHEEEEEVWCGKLQAFRNLYSFLSKLIPYQDSDLEKLFTFLRHLTFVLSHPPSHQLNRRGISCHRTLGRVAGWACGLTSGPGGATSNR